MIKSVLKQNEECTDLQLQIIEIQENERKRIARELHDTTLQIIAHVLHQIELGEIQMEKDLLGARLELMSARKNLRAVIDEIRNLIFDLRPMSFDDLGLKETLVNFIDLIQNYYDFDVTSDIDDIRGSEYFLISIYRIAREALVNALKHSGGNRIYFSCKESEHTVDMIIADNGKGIAQEDLHKKNHYGLNVMKERVDILNGTMDFLFDNGAKIVVSIPVTKF